MALCKNPFMAGSVPCPCNKCIPCLINRKRLWKHRILLESYLHQDNSFVTLTYDEKTLYYKNDKTGQQCLEPTLRPRDLKNFLKSIRKSFAPNRLRFYGVGEYGDRSWRPHYHLALFGYPSCLRGGTRHDRHANGQSCCPPCDDLLKAWGKGGIDNACLEPESAGYIAGYVTKKLSNADDDKARKLLNGRYPEFSRMSNRPGIAAGVVDKLADALSSDFGDLMLTEHGDVPTSLFHGDRSFPLGRYLRNKLRKKLNLEEVMDETTGEFKYAAKERTLQAFKTELQTMFVDAFKDEERKKQPLTLKHLISDRDGQKILNIETKHNLKQKAKIL